MSGHQQEAQGSAQDLDALIAQRVMGLVPCADWEVTNFGSAGGPALLKKCEHPADTCYPTVTTGSIYGTIGGPRRYSADIRAAWQVVERILAIPREFRLERLAAPGWRVGTRSARGSRRWAWVTAETAPEAICRAALELVQENSNGRGPSL